MKKYLFPALALGLVMTSCQSDEPFAPGEGGEKQVTFTLNVPGELGTRADFGANKSGVSGVSNEGTANIKYTLVLDANGDKKILDNDDATINGKTATFSPTVVLGREYKITAYASLGDAWDGENAIDITKHFNDETKDAYFYTTTHNFAEGDLQPLALKRPFGKLRLLATDYKLDNSGVLNTAVKNVKITYNDAQAAEFDVFNSVFEFGGNFVNVDAQTFGYYGAEEDGAMPIFADYVPANPGDNMVDFTVEVTYTNDETYSRTFNDIPVKRNALTTLKGNFFTANSEIKVEVKDNFEGGEFVSVATASQLQDAINNGGNGETIILTNDIVLTEPLVFSVNSSSSAPTRSGVANSFVLNLNGKTIAGTDTGTASYGLITIKKGADLTIEGNGAISLTATQERGWNAYSSVISNQQGKLTVNGGTIEHHGGTAMAYAIDNLTNGKGTYAETIINGGTIKSKYRAIRQFLNGTEANNILTVNGGTIESTGGNKSIWMQDASASANSGTLKVYGDASINSDIYIDGNTSWDVEAYIEKAALKNGSTIITENIPEGCVTVAVRTADELQAVAGGMNVVLLNDLTITPEEMATAPYGNKMALSHNGGVFNGNGKNISVTANGDNYVVMTNGGTIKNLDIDRGFRGIVLMYPNQDVYVDNVNIGVDDEVCYTINTAEGDGTHDLYVSNSTLKGWCSIGTAVKSVTFTNCVFGQGTYYTDVYGRLVKPYVNAVFDGCDFCSMAYLDLSAFVGTKVTLKNCTVNGVKLTAENWTSLVAPEATCGEGQISVELKNGTYLTADNVADYIVFE